MRCVTPVCISSGTGVTLPRAFAWVSVWAATDDASGRSSRLEM
jgi:hypothetical protein